MLSADAAMQLVYPATVQKTLAVSQSSGGTALTFCTTLGIEETESSSFPSSALSIYPNPAHNAFTVSLNNEMKTAVLKTYDITGREAYTTTVNTKLQTLNLNISPGVYFVKVSDEEKVYIQKLVIE